MNSFVFNTPTKVIFGKGSESQVGSELKGMGAKSVLVHYGSESARRSGLLDRIGGSLKEAGIEFVELGGVVPNPRLSLVYKGIETVKQNNIDFILAVGGGSAIDSSKAIAIGAANPDIDVWDVFLRKATVNKSMPLGCVLTISAAGSEMSNSSVITNENGMLKRGLSSELNRPKFAIMNPELTFTLPVYQIKCGVVDIMMHTMERYFYPGNGQNKMTDAIANSLLRIVIENGRKAIENPCDYDAQSEIMWASSLSHNTLTGLGGIMDFSVHQLGHEISGMFDIAHGATLSCMWASWARYVYKTDIARFKAFAENVWGIKNFGSDEELALEGIEATEDFFRSIGMPIGFADLSCGTLSDSQIDKLVEKCTFFNTRTIGAFKKLDANDIRNIYNMANC